MNFKKILFFLIIIICPIIVYADTWLDDISYRDISWFDQNTYSTTTEYVIDSEKKLAGLAYLVNEKEYSFEDKDIVLIPNSSHPVNSLKIFNMTGHTWIPIKDTFKGSFKVNNERLILISKEKDVSFINNNSCKIKDPSLDIVNDSNPCSIVEYSWNINYEGITDDEIVVKSNAAHLEKVSIEFKPKDGYYLESFEVKDINNMPLEVTRLSEYRYKFAMPDNDVSIIVKYKEKDASYCVAIKGNGRNIGDEIACGTENFYVISNDRTNIRMLTKYNLYTGYTIYKVKLENGQNCQELANTAGGKEVRWEPHTEAGYCYYQKNINTNKILQSKDAIGIHRDKDGNYVYPQVGNVNFYGIGTKVKNIPLEESTFYDFSLDLSMNEELGMPVGSPLFYYKNELVKLGINVKDIAILSITDLNNIINAKVNKKLPIKNWSDTIQTQISNNEMVPIEHSIEDLKQYIPDDLNWLYSTTYWNSSIYDYSNNLLYLFTTSYGGFFGAGIPIDQTKTIIDAGLRPVITIPTTDLYYLIRTKTDGKGKVEVINKADGNEKVSFKIKTEEGYELKDLTIVTDSGEKIKLNNKSIANNQFTMPYDNVTIETSFVKSNQALDKASGIINPNTKDIVFIILGIMLISISVYFLLLRYKKNKMIKC